MNRLSISIPDRMNQISFMSFAANMLPNLHSNEILELFNKYKDGSDYISKQVLLDLVKMILEESANGTNSNNNDASKVAVEPLFELHDSPGVVFLDYQEFSQIGHFPKRTDSNINFKSISHIDYDNSLVVYISHAWLVTPTKYENDETESNKKGNNDKSDPSAHSVDSFKLSPPHIDNTNNDKYNICCEGVRQIWQNHAKNMSNCYVWIDFSCMYEPEILQKYFHRKHLLEESPESNQNSLYISEVVKLIVEAIEFSDCIFTPLLEDHAVGSYSHKEMPVGLNKQLFHEDGLIQKEPTHQMLKKNQNKTKSISRSTSSEYNPSHPHNHTHGFHNTHNGSFDVNDSSLLSSQVELEFHHTMVSWTHSEYGYLHRAWCRMEQLLAHNIPLHAPNNNNSRNSSSMLLSLDKPFISSDLLGSGTGILINNDNIDVAAIDSNNNNNNNNNNKYSKLSYGLSFNLKYKRRPHYIFSSYDMANLPSNDNNNNFCHIIPPIHNTSFLTNLHPLKGHLTDQNDFIIMNGLLNNVSDFLKNHHYDKNNGDGNNNHNYGYDGDYHRGRMTGNGIAKYSDNNIYIGQFSDGRRQGNGVFYYITGDIYDGGWNEDEKDGFGVYMYRSGNSITGNWMNGQLFGSAIKRFANGDEYEGEWIEGKMHGQGVYRYKHGDVYKGDFNNNRIHGQGTYNYANG
eukprot:gene15064-20270_t